MCVELRRLGWKVRRPVARGWVGRTGGRRRGEKGKYETKREKGYGRGWNTRRNENR